MKLKRGRIATILVAAVAVILIGLLYFPRPKLGLIPAQTVQPLQPARTIEGRKNPSYDYFMEVDQLAQELPAYKDDPVVGKMAVKVDAMLSQNRELLTRAFKSPEGLSIDLVLTLHMVSGSPRYPKTRQLIHDIQQTAKATLEDNHYDIVGYEASALPDVTLDGCAQETYAASLLVPEETTDLVTQEQIRQNLELVIAYGFQAVLQYKRDHPEVRVVGLEDTFLGLLNGKVDKILHHDALASKPLSQYRRLYDLIIDVRSELALAKMIVAVQKHPINRAVLVIGAAHGPKLESLAQSLGLHCRVFDAVPRSAKDQYGLR